MSLAYSAPEITAMVRDIALIVFFALGAIGLLVAIVIGIKFYKKVGGVVEKVDDTAGKVQGMVANVEDTASTVKSAATNVNRGMRAGAFARSAMDSVFGIGRRDSKPEKTEEKNEAEESAKPPKTD